jgi:serine/threonine-protein kinase
VSALGPTIADRYELDEVLGRGGMSEVRAGRDLRLGREVAVKLLTTDMADGSRGRERFEAEARAVASLSHPNVVLVFDSGEHDGVLFLVMERLPGRTLADEMAGGPLAPDRACQVATDVLAALGAAHAAGIVHRDIKPGNVLLCPDGSVKVADFGIAKADSAMSLTGQGVLLGTPGYLAPERLTGEPATPQSDLYSVGVLLYEALSGRPLFEAESPAALINAICASRPVPLAERAPDVPPGVAQAVDRALEKEPSARFATAAEMKAALGDAPADPGATAVLVAPGPRPAATENLGAPRPLQPRRATRRRQLVAAGVGLLVVLAVVSGLVARSGRHPEGGSQAGALTAGPPEPLPAGAGPIPPGRYRTTALQPALQLTLDNGWSARDAEAADVLALGRTGPGESGTELTFLSVGRVFLRDRTYQGAADYVAPGAAEPTPPNLLDWLRRHPRLRVSKPDQARVGGLPAMRVDVEAVAPYPSEACRGPCVALFQLDAGQGKYRIVKLEQGKTMRLYVAAVKGKTLVVSIVVPTNGAGPAVATAEPVVKSAKFVS